MAILGSHNSWSYLPVKRWWMRPLAFMARCQRLDIRRQYEMGVRCFDLRVRFHYGQMVVAHGIVEYAIDMTTLIEDLEWIDVQGGCYVRVIHEVRNKRQYESTSKMFFESFCYVVRSDLRNIRFWNGRNLYNYEKDYEFGEDPSNDGKYASVCAPRLIDDWWPWLYARLHNRRISLKDCDKEILLVDFVDMMKI